MDMLTNFFQNRGWTRDDAKWTWMIVAAVIVGLSTALTSDQTAAYYGFPVQWLPRLRGLALIVGIVAAAYKTSDLPGSGKVASLLIVCALALGVTSCAKARHVAVVTDQTLAAAIFAVDDAEYAACQAHVIAADKCAALNTPIKKALQDVKALTAALQATPANGKVPTSLPDLLQDLLDVSNVMNSLRQGPDLKPLVDKVQAAETKAVNQLAALTGAK